MSDLLDLAARVAAMGVKPQRVAIPADRVDLARAAGLEVRLEVHHVSPLVASGAPVLAVRIRHAHRDDPGEMAYLRGSFGEGYKQSSNRLFKLPWPDFKRLERPRLDAVLARGDTQLLVADLDGAVAGWLAWSPGRRVDTVHWTHTRLRIGKGETLRRRGVMRALVDAAGLKQRLVYTHRGAKRSDEWIVPWLARRGVTAAFQSIKEWSE